MSWESSEETAKQKANLGRYFKLQDDGDLARLVLLTEPDEQEKEGSTGPFTVYSVDVWNVDGSKRQTWDMGSSQFKSLLGMKRALGLAKLYSQELIVVRNGRKGDTGTTYTWTADGKITEDTLDAMAAAGEAPAHKQGAPTIKQKQAPAPAPAAKIGPTVGSLEGGLVLADTLDELRQAFEQAWGDAEGWDDVQAGLQTVYERRKSDLQAPAPAKKRAPSF
jgi:hypothetical protein